MGILMERKSVLGVYFRMKTGLVRSNIHDQNISHLDE